MHYYAEFGLLLNGQTRGHFQKCYIKDQKLNIHKQKLKICNSVECCLVSYSYFCFDFSGNNSYTAIFF